MFESQTVSSSRSEILRHFQQRAGEGRGQHLDDVTYDLIAKILSQHDSGDVESLIAFCANEDNLRPWVHNEADRIIFSAGLVAGLREMTFVGH